MSKQPPPAPTASAVGPCPTVIQIVGRPGTGSLPSTIAPPDLPHRTEKVTVNVLNGQVETFETKPISVELKGITGDVSMIVNAYSVNRITGNMPVVDWNKYKHRWPHLRNIDFPCSSRRPVVNMLPIHANRTGLYPLTSRNSRS